MSVVAMVALDARPLMQSVGLVCTCGKAIAGIEGVVACRHCGAVYSVSVLVLVESRAREPEAVSANKEKRSSVA